MSGRSAYVRKQITQPKQQKDKGIIRDRVKSSPAEHHHEIPAMSANAMPDFPMPTGPVGTGVGTTNARFLKFSDPMTPAMEQGHRSRSSPSTRSIGSAGSAGLAGMGSSGQGGSNVGSDSRRDFSSSASHISHPLEEYAYARARKPIIRTEDISGIEKSGLRSIIDKRSDGVRKGLAKTFTFNKRRVKDDTRSIVERPQSAATVRPDNFLFDPEQAFEDFAANNAAMRMQQERLQEMLQHQNPQRNPQTPQEIWDVSVMAPPPPASKLPPLPSGPAAPPITRWIGAGRPTARWNKLRKDPELWDPNGDVLVFLGHKGQAPRPPPSFRLSSHIIEATESRYLITLLREGSTEEDINMPPSPAGAPPLLRDLRGGRINHSLGRGGQPTPPMSEDASLGDVDGQISYEMYFPTPSGLTKADALRHQLTTRNVFALLYHASLVGLSLYQALADLHTRLDSYMPPESDNVGQIINYLSARGIDDVRSEPESAMSLLAWSEGSEVRWEEGWRECFIHCAGMYGDLESCADYKFTTPITRALLERACLETQLRIQAAEERLTDFAYGDLWSASELTPARDAADRLQQMLIEHYTDVYGSWPPVTTQRPGSPGAGEEAESEEMWLSRTVAANLQKDFGALYDYLVNRDIVWDMSEARSGRKWMMVSESGNRSFEADTPDMPITDMLIEFDNKSRFPHIPHPYPLIPESVPPVASSGSQSSGLFKSGSKKGGESGHGSVKGSGGGAFKGAGAMERRVHLAYTESTNIYALGSDFMQSDLIDAFVKFEKSDMVGEVDPATARRGRWILIYGILQTLATVSVDSPTVRFRDGVSYHLSLRLRGTRIPPWRGTSGAVNSEASHELSHCWLAPRTWSGHNTGSSAGDSHEESGGESPVMPASAALAIRQGSVATLGRNSILGLPGGRAPRSYPSPAPSAYGGSMGFGSPHDVISESEELEGEQLPRLRSRHNQQQQPQPRRRSRDPRAGRIVDSTFGPPTDDMTLPIHRREYGSVSSAGTGATERATPKGRMGSRVSSRVGSPGTGVKPSPKSLAPTPLLTNLGSQGTYMSMDDVSPLSPEEERYDDAVLRGR